MKPLMTIVVFAVIAAGCAPANEPDAYGNVEAVTVTVSAELGGQLQQLNVTEGQTLRANEAVGVIESVGLSLERDQLEAQQAATSSRIAEVDRQIDVLGAQRGTLEAQRAAATAQRAALEATREIAQRSYDRTLSLFSQQAATAQQRDQAEREIKTAEQQVRVQDEQIRAIDQQLQAQTAQVAAAHAQRTTAVRQVASAAALVARATERLGKAAVRNPQDGTVLVVYAHVGEVVQTGQPLYRIANLVRVDVPAYVSESQLAAVRLGQEVRVSFDRDNARQSLGGTVSWIASQAEFTPTPIQTREERTDLVYAVKIAVPNENGALKIGMPVDVSWSETAP